MNNSKKMDKKPLIQFFRCDLLNKVMAGACIIVHPIDFLELGNPLEGFLAKGMFVLESV